MFIGIVEIDLKIFHAYSLKEKRSVLTSLIRRLSNRYNISIAEVDNLDKLNYTTIGISTVSNSKSHVQISFDKILEFIDNDERLEIIDIKYEIM